VRNPFEIGMLASGRHFADREAEVERIARALREPGSRLVVFGDRRLGKTSAIERAAEQVRRGGEQVAIASLATASDPIDAGRRLLLAVRDAIGRNWRETLEAILARLEVGYEVRPSPAAGQPPSLRIAVGLRPEDRGAEWLPDVLDAVHAQLDAEGRSLGLAIDEFQQIHRWGGEGSEWALKTVMERHQRLGYVLAGSKKSLIEGMITTKGRALWKQVEPLEFGPIDPDILAEWIVQQGARTGVRIPFPVADDIVSMAGPRTRDVVQLARAVWDDALRAGEAREGAAAHAAERIVREQAAIYERIWRELNSREQQLLRVFVAEPGVQILSTDTERRFGLGAKTTVQSAVGRLVDEEHLVRAGGGYVFDDPFFRRWVETAALGDLGIEPPAQ